MVAVVAVAILLGPTRNSASNLQGLSLDLTLSVSPISSQHFPLSLFLNLIYNNDYNDAAANIIFLLDEFSDNLHGFLYGKYPNEPHTRLNLHNGKLLSLYSRP